MARTPPADRAYASRAVGEDLVLRPVGWVRSALVDRDAAPRQGDEGAGPATIVLHADCWPAAADLVVGQEVLVLTWLHLADRRTLRTHPRGDVDRPEVGVFGTRSPDRPNPVGLHRVRLTLVQEPALAVDALEAVDGTPVLDVKAVLGAPGDR